MSESNLTIETFTEATFGENGYVLYTRDDQGAKVGWIIDPSFPPQVHHILEYVTKEEITVEKVLLTHGHGDHIAGIDAVKKAHPDALVMLAEPDQEMLTDPQKNLSAPFGIGISCQTPADEDLPPSAQLWLGRYGWQVLDTSGHSPGGRSFYCQQAQIVITGDALFCGSVGRVDFPGSDPETLFNNLKTQLLVLPGETKVYSGHGPITTIENERKYNPFLSE